VTPQASQPDRALAAVIDGANTATDIAAELGVSSSHAAALLCKLKRQGYLRWTGRKVPPPRGEGGKGCRVYEVVSR